jgi:selenocysteine lyase/cysteine desulfurase
MPAVVDFAELRRREFARLDASGIAYLDYTGAALYPASLVCRDMRRLSEGVFGNPHSESGPSLESTAAIERARESTLRFLDADPAEYDVVFTANTSGAVRIIAEAFPFARASRLVLTADNHNSVNGLRLAARGAAVEYVPLDRNLRSEDPAPWLRKTAKPSLFAYPAQSNFSGVRHPLEWVRAAQASGYRVLLDAAAYLPCAALSLRELPADFVALSFYKLFGYPTGIGALVARREALAALRRTYFAGGTVQFASVQNHMMRMKTSGEAFEDGTPNFLSMAAVCDGLEWMEAHCPCTSAAHLCTLKRRLLDGFADLGERVTIYGASDSGTVAFNLKRPFEIVEAAARDRGIAIRGGCFCNPGAAEAAFDLPAGRARACLEHEDFTIPRFRECLGGRPVGALRVSLGVANNAADIDRLFDLLEEQTRVH